MKRIRLFVGLVAMSALISVLSSSATAQIGPWGVWGPWYAYPNAPYACSYGTIPSPPYFAIHPPVYYGPRIRMAYGHSPIARPPLTVVAMPRHREMPEAPRQTELIIRNPHVGDDSAESGQGTAATGPQIVENPYYSPNTADDGSGPRIAAHPRAVATKKD